MSKRFLTRRFLVVGSIAAVAIAGASAPAAIPHASGSVTTASHGKRTSLTRITDAEREAMVDAARPCLDPRHMALVTNALRRGMSIETRELVTWCARA